MKPRLLAAAACAALTGCTLHFDSRSLGVPVTMAAAAGPGPTVPGDTFTVTGHAVYLFWGLATARQPDLKQTLAGQLGAGGAVQNLAIHAHAGLGDVLLSVLTLGVVSATSVTYSGVVTRSGP